MESSRAGAEKLIIDYFNHGRNTPPGSWHAGQAPKPEQHTIYKQQAQRPLRQKGGHDDDQD